METLHRLRNLDIRLCQAMYLCTPVEFKLIFILAVGDYGTLSGNGLRERTTHRGDYIGCNPKKQLECSDFTVSCLLSFVEKVDCRS